MNMAGKGQTPEDYNESLVKALESIKSLLEKSESKLSAARSSIQQARTASGLPANADEDLVPVLDDIVYLKKEMETTTSAAASDNDALQQQLRTELLEILRDEMGKLETRLLAHLEKRLSQLKK